MNGTRVRVYTQDENAEKLQAVIRLAEINAQSLAKSGTLSSEELSGIKALFPKQEDAAEVGSIVRTAEGLAVVGEAGAVVGLGDIAAGETQLNKGAGA